MFSKLIFRLFGVKTALSIWPVSTWLMNSEYVTFFSFLFSAHELRAHQVDDENDEDEREKPGAEKSVQCSAS